MSSCQALVSFLGEAVDRVGCVAGALSEVLAHLQPSPSASAAEHNLADGPRKAVLRWLSAPQLKTGGQQDAAEALELILSSVAEERVGSIAMQLEPLTRMGAVALEIGAGNASGESAAADEHSGSRSAVCVGLGDGGGGPAEQLCSAAAGRDGVALPMPEADRSPPPPPFQGFEAQSVTCLACGTPSATRVSAFHVLHLTIPSLGGSVRAGASLADCLRGFAQPETVDGWVCPACSHSETRSRAEGSARAASGEAAEVLRLLSACRGRVEGCRCAAAASALSIPWARSPRTAVKRVGVARLPKVLCLSLKRASLSPTGELVKLRGHVSFPLLLDMRPFCDWGLEKGLRPLSDGVMDHGAAPPLAIRPSRVMEWLQRELTAGHGPEALFELSAVVVHHGGPSSGHYTAYRCCRHEGSEEQHWKYTSDRTIRDAELNEVLQAEAALLFYERKSRNCPA
uniref:ubiquitinyl hydrolase 1 n=1 Tax=Tetraselmis sp. GSL018 TaxID=582737 RepID=A0A061S5F0_9CHLO|mmetsp:Transcript_40585/g.96423  ORF Transcript_40585/g.96423 Transcript_40585/m.96423 type:complete len:456 (-) Transcript_40585:349-1716(-)|eukprot:CAMPEP_0177604670 /NCGR_PEP_ID=MMETSP0419_2-20121207/16255_1 /TAXON_ID=582737 /ORGANISM="Tetraselmis sp., Strain GSL018" /LENGTH=455 /DNA_ID=CAMNT_0019098695 /DNA_START=622 /DNA_END=1989 /DNA_ORIENTATION=-